MFIVLVFVKKQTEAKSGDFQRYGSALALNFSKMSTRQKMTGKAFALAKTRI